MKLKTIIIEDVEANLNTLMYHLDNDIHDVEVVGIVKNIESGIKMLSEKEIDLVISDIELPGGTSFDIFKALVQEDKINFDIIFMSAYNDSDYIRKAFQYAAIDYIEKPIDVNKIRSAIERVKSKKEIDLRNQKISVLIDNLNLKEDKDKKVGIQLIRGNIQFIVIKDILYLEADATITHIYLKNGEKLTSTKHLGFYSKSLINDSSFFQISNSIVINTDCIHQYNHRDRLVTFENGVKVYASKRGGVDFKEYLAKPKEQSSSKSLLKKILKSIISE